MEWNKNRIFASNFFKLPVMNTIQIKDKLFTVSIKEQDIQKEVIRVANEINRDLAGKNPLFLSVLNGSFMLRPI